MPYRQTYEFECVDCATTEELKFTLSEYLARTDEVVLCPACNGIMRRKIGVVGVVFKGDGWADKQGGGGDE